MHGKSCGFHGLMEGETLIRRIQLFRNQMRRTNITRIIQESSKRADISVIVKAYTPKPSKTPLLPRTDREIKHMIPNKLTREEKVSQIERETFITPSIEIEKYLDMAKETCEQIVSATKDSVSICTRVR